MGSSRCGGDRRGQGLFQAREAEAVSFAAPSLRKLRPFRSSRCCAQGCAGLWSGLQSSCLPVQGDPQASHQAWSAFLQKKNKSTSLREIKILRVQTGRLNGNYYSHRGSIFVSSSKLLCREISRALEPKSGNLENNVNRGHRDHA